MDRGVAFKFEYLGNTTLKKLDGLASVQTMLRDMYALHRKCDSKDRQQREITSTVLQTTDEGLYIRFRRKNTRTDEEVFYSAPSILLWEAVRFRHIVGDKRGKKIDSAFEPLEKDPTTKPTNMFSALDKKYHFLLPLTHPALFLCVLRRPAVRGSKPVIDLHVWRCTDNDEALEINVQLDRVQTLYAVNQSKRSALFDNSMRPTTTKAPTVMDDNMADRREAHIQRSRTFTADAGSRPAHAQSMMDIRPAFTEAPAASKSNYGSNERVLNDRQLRDTDLSPWDQPAPHLLGGREEESSDDDSDTEWQYQSTGGGGARGRERSKNDLPSPPSGSGLSKSRSMINGRSGSAELLSHGNSSGGSKDDFDNIRLQNQQPPQRLPRIALQQQQAAASSKSRDYFQDNDPIYANRSDIRSSDNSYNDGQAAVDAKLEDFRPKQSGAKDPLYASKSDMANNSRQQSRDDVTYLKQSDFLLPSKQTVEPAYGKLPQTQNVLSGPRTQENPESVYAVVAKQRNVANGNNGQKIAAEPASPTKSPQSDFFFGMTQAKKATAVNDQPQNQAPYNVANGNGKIRNSPNPTNNRETDNFYRPTQQQQQQQQTAPSSNPAADRVARAKQLAAESRLLAQYPEEDPVSRPGYDEGDSRDRYPVGPALKMLNTGGEDRPVARIPPNKSPGISVFPSTSPVKDKDFDKSPTAAMTKPLSASSSDRNFNYNDNRNGNSNGRAAMGGQGLRRTNTEYVKRSPGQDQGQGDVNGRNSREPSNMYTKNPNTNNNHGGVERSISAKVNSSNANNNNNNRRQPTANNNYDMNEGINDTPTQKKKAEIASVMDDIEIDNMRRTMKPMGRVNLEESLGYFP